MINRKLRNILTTQNIEDDPRLPLGRVLDAEPCKRDCDRDDREYDGNVGSWTMSNIELLIQYVNSPPFTIIRPCSDDKKQDRLNSETDAIREKNDGIDCEAVR